MDPVVAAAGLSWPPTDPDEALRLAVEHYTLAGLTPGGGISLRAYAEALPRLNWWSIYNRP